MTEPRTRLKLCGMFRPEDIQAVNRWSPDYIGFITYEKSHRYVTPEQAAALKCLLNPGIPAVGVFVNKSVEDIVPYVAENVIDIIQLHGSEDNGFIDELRTALSEEVSHKVSTPIWKAFKIRSEEDLRTAEASAADLILLDNGMGTGETFDWSLLEQGVNRPYLLAGGLRPENIPEAIHRLHPYGLDLSSGVETDHRKDPEKIRAAVEAVANGKKI